MKRQRILAAVAGAMLMLSGAGAAHAQMAVFDGTTYAQVLKDAQTGLNQLQQLERQVQQGEQLVTQSSQLLTSLNQISNVNGLATVLEQPTLRGFLPDANTYVGATSGTGNLTTLGVIGQAAQVIRTANQVFTPSAGSTFGTTLTASGNQAALNLATGQAIVQAGASRLTGLQQLEAGLNTAANARAVLDLQARLQAEEAMIANDQMRIQGLAMTQAAQAQVQTQRAQEQAAAASQARLAIYQSAFQ
jgi:type IV secretion system protein VirB5